MLTRNQEATVFENMIRAAKLDVDFYNTVEHDDSYTSQAFGVVVLTSILVGIGNWLTVRRDFIGTIIGGIIGWVIWAAITYFIGTRVFRGTADYGEMLRVLGFASAPRALGVIPFFLFGFVGAVWALIASIVAIREGLDFSTGKAIGTAIVGWIVLIVLSAIWFAIF